MWFEIRKLTVGWLITITESKLHKDNDKDLISFELITLSNPSIPIDLKTMWIHTYVHIVNKTYDSVEEIKNGDRPLQKFNNITVIITRFKYIFILSYF